VNYATRSPCSCDGVPLDQIAQAGPAAGDSADYTHTAAGTLTFADGVTSQTFTVPIRDELVIENNEFLWLLLALRSGAAKLGTPASARLTIENDDALGQIQFAADDFALWESDGATGVRLIRVGGKSGSQTVDAVLTGTVAEGNSGTVSAVFTISLSSRSPQEVTVGYATANNSAAAPGDYTAASDTVRFAAGETRRTITVAVRGDTMYEPNERFLVDLKNPTGATLDSRRSRGTGTINNDDTQPTVAISPAAPARVTVTEGHAGTTAAHLVTCVGKSHRELRLPELWLSVCRRQPSADEVVQWSRKLAPRPGAEAWWELELLGSTCIYHERDGVIVHGPVFRYGSPVVNMPFHTISGHAGKVMEGMVVYPRAFPPGSHPAWNRPPSEVPAHWDSVLAVHLAAGPSYGPGVVQMRLSLFSHAWLVFGRSFHPSLTTRCWESNWQELVQAVHRLAYAEEAVERVTVSVNALRRQLEGTSVLEALRSLPKLGELELWSDRPARMTPAEPVLEQSPYTDSDIERALKTCETSEARSWLSQNGFRMVAEIEKHQAMSLVEQLYELGADKVIAVGIEQSTDTSFGGEAAFAAMLVVQVSQKEPNRRRVFDWITDRFHRRGRSCPRDDAQQYLALAWYDLEVLA